ncbi:MAG: YitT family protein [Chloroflexi bacterium]|nr:YitT family protein [Chloroflexota bacterium]
MKLKQRLNHWRANINWRNGLQTYLQMTLGGLLLIVSYNVFQIPAKLAPGGMGGIGILINDLTGFPPGTTMLLLNIPILYLGFRTLGRFQFLIRTLYAVLLYNLGVDIFARWLPPGITDDLLLNSLYGGVIGGIGSGLLYRARSTVAGTGVISRIVQIRTGLPISQVYIFIDGGIILLLGLRFGWENALYAMIMLFIWGLAADYTLEGPSVIKTVFIVTDYAADVSQAIITRLGIGVTAWPAQGMYSGKEHDILFCTVSRSDVNTVRLIVSEIDSNAFIVVGQGHRATGGLLRSSSST